MYYLVLADIHGDNSLVRPVPQWEEMDDDAQVDFLNDHTEFIGLLCAGVYPGDTPDEALTAANENWREWIGGCVA